MPTEHSAGDPTNGKLTAAIVWAGTALSLVALCLQIVSAGPVGLRRPQTVLDNTPPAGATARTAKLLRFLTWARPRLPRGASVAIANVSTTGGLQSLSGDYLVAIGQLPDGQVMPLFDPRDASAIPPDYVLAFERPFTDSRYTAIARFGDSALYRKLP
jgi:hypothetical protein